MDHRRLSGRAAGPDAPLAAAELLALEATRFLRAHHREPVSIHDLADHLAYSPSHLTRLFTAAVGASPMRYLASWRLHEAKRLLLTEYLGVAETCHEVGFTSVGTFSRRFARDVGLPPARLRRAADAVADSSLPAVSLLAPSTTHRLVRLRVPPALRPGLGHAPYLWMGTFPTPVPCGPPHTGALRRDVVEVLLPVTPTAPWLLATVTPSGAGIEAHLAPGAPLVARHPYRLDGGVSGRVIDIELRPAHPWDHPMLTDLPALWPG